MPKATITHAHTFRSEFLLREYLQTKCSQAPDHSNMLLLILLLNEFFLETCLLFLRVRRTTRSICRHMNAEAMRKAIAACWWYVLYMWAYVRKLFRLCSLLAII